MITICRAEDGQVHQVNASIRDIEAIGSLEHFLSQEIGINAELLVAYLSDGRRLTSSNIRDLGTVQDGCIFVFNKHYLEYDVDEVLKLLSVKPAFQPAVEDETATTPPIRHAQLAASYLQAAQKHQEAIQHFEQALTVQHQGLQIASKNLDFNVLAISETFNNIAATAQRELQRQESLLNGVDADLELISKVAVHVEFCSEAVRKAIEAGDPQRVLGDYVSKQKMQSVKDSCAKTHEELLRRFSEVELAVGQLRDGADFIRSTTDDNRVLDEARSCFRTSQELLDKINNVAATLETPISDPDPLLQELKNYDESHRHELLQIVNKKNLYTHQCLTVLRHVGTMNNEIVSLPQILSALSASFRLKTNFSHIQRLHSMLYAYGATIIEIVRRKEFTRFFYQRAQNILEVMAKLSSSERKRRQVYRSEIHGMLPFETQGMDDPVPVIDFSPTGNPDAVYSFERSDVDDLLRVLRELESYAQTRLNGTPFALTAVRNCRESLDRLINKMDALEAAFDKIAERSLLSQSRLTSSRRRSIEAEERAMRELAQQLQLAQDDLAQQEHNFEEERSNLRSESRRLKRELESTESELSAEQEKSARLERELKQARSQLDSETVARRILEDRNGELSADISLQRREIARALSDATEQAKEAEMSRQELARVREEFEEVKHLEQRNADKVAHLLDEQSKTLRNLEEARARGEDLEHQIHVARTESEDVNQALKVASFEKDRLLKAQASEHDKIIRDHIAEADGDRAILGRQFSELQAVLEHKDRELKNIRGDFDVTNADAAGLREELQRVERELHEVRHVERLLREDLKAGRVSQHAFEQHIENNNRLIAQILDVAIHFRSSHAKVLHAAQLLGSHPSSARLNSNSLIDSFSPTPLRHNILPQFEEPSPIDPDDPIGALEILREFDHDHFLEIVTKSIRKWQKQCKEYRERSKGKISFRNFAKGDLALFLPTRNSVSKPWAAFNVSFPHYFLQASDHLAEQLKTREWIVARITLITEGVVDQKDPTSNPYGLGDGVKYYMLEVEDWTQPSHNKKRLSSRRISVDVPDEKEGSISRSNPSSTPFPPGPPEPEVEDTFMVTHPINSHLFPTRARSNSSPAARPSSLSRLLAQASPTAEAPTELSSSENNNNNNPPSTTSKPIAVNMPLSASPPESPRLLLISGGGSGSQDHSVTNGNSKVHDGHLSPAPNNKTPSSPLRPASRASRLSNTSRFSSTRKPTSLGIVASALPKAAATTALSEPVLPNPSSPTDSNNPFRSPIMSSPDQSILEAVSSTIGGGNNNNNTSSSSSPRRRTSSLHPMGSSSSSSQATVVIQRPSSAASTTLANLANSLGMMTTWSRKRNPAAAAAVVGILPLTPPVESVTNGSGNSTTTTTTPRTVTGAEEPPEAADNTLPAAVTGIVTTISGNQTAREALKRF